MTNQLNTPIELLSPSQILFGTDVSKRIGAWMVRHGLSRAFVVADSFNVSRVNSLGIESEAIVFSDFHPEPDTKDLEKLMAAVQAAQPDVIIGFGGGSAMDLAKVAAVLPNSGQQFVDIVGPDKVLGRGCRLVQVPTTAGTGSEVGMRSLVTDAQTHAKLAVQSNHMLADLAVVDPQLMVTMPRAVTVATGVDALAHCVEAYTNKKSHPTIDLYALEGIRLIGKWLPIAAEDGNNSEARAAMALAALYGGYCLGPVNTTSGHAVAYPLSSRHNIAHGAANALIFPHTLAFNAPVVPERTAEILKCLGLPPETSPEKVFQVVYQWCVDLGCEMKMSSYQVPADDLQTMANEAHAIRRLLDNNPRDMTVEDIYTIYLAAA